VGVLRSAAAANSAILLLLLLLLEGRRRRCTQHGIQSDPPAIVLGFALWQMTEVSVPTFLIIREMGQPS